MIGSYAFLARKFEHIINSNLFIIMDNLIVFINYNGHIPYCCVRLVLMKYVLYDNNLSQYI